MGPRSIGNNYTNGGIIPSLIRPGQAILPTLNRPVQSAPMPQYSAPAPAGAAPAPAPVYQAPNNPTQQLPPTPPVYDPAAAAAAAAAQAAAQKKAIMDASIAAIEQNIASLATRKANTLKGVDDRYNLINTRYTDQENQNQAAYTREVEANEGMYSRNQSLALQSAAQGRQSLFANLGAIGALGPSALKLANRAVARSANNDIGDSRRTFENNATTLTEARDKTVQEEKNRRLEAEAAREAERQAAEYDYNEALQKAYSDIAQAAAQGEDLGRATEFTGKAGSLYSTLAANTRPIVAAYTPRDIALDTSKLSSYIAGQKMNTVKTSGGGTGAAINSPIYALARRREELV